MTALQPPFMNALTASNPLDTAQENIELERQYWLKKHGVPLETGLSVRINPEDDDLALYDVDIDRVFKIVSISVDIDGIAIGLGTGDDPSNYIHHYDGMRIHELEVVTV